MSEVPAENIELCGSWSSSKFSTFQIKNLILGRSKGNIGKERVKK